MTDKYFYALLRLAPDRTRDESVNFGLVVFLADRLDVRVLPEMGKVRALNPNVDTELLRRLPTALDEFLAPLESVESRHRMLARFPLIHASDLGYFACAPRDYDANVESILDRLVRTPARPYVKRDSRLETSMKEMFRKHKLFSDDVADVKHHVVANYPVAAAEGLVADFAVQNGVMHFTSTLDLRGKESTLKQDKRGQAALKAMTLHLADKRFSQCRRYAVVLTTAKTRDIVEPHIALLRSDAHEVFDFSVKQDKAAYFERIHAATRAN